MKELEGIRIPIMALRGISVFPKLIFSFDVGREKSIRALDEAMSGDQHMILLMQKDVIVDEPAPEDLYDVGVLVHVRQVLKMPGEIIRIGSFPFSITRAWTGDVWVRIRISSVI